MTSQLLRFWCFLYSWQLRKRHQKWCNCDIIKDVSTWNFSLLNVAVKISVKMPVKFQKIKDFWIVGYLNCWIFWFSNFWILGFLYFWISVFLDSWIFLASFLADSIPFLKYVPSYLRSAFLPVSTPAMPSFLSLFGCTLESHHCWQSPFILQWIIARLHSQIEKGVEPHCWWTIMGFLL